MKLKVSIKIKNCYNKKTKSKKYLSKNFEN